jgi:isopentenyl diphosphate isomerase/L-lactate dehydrogenase-like FMN-dependent dehydrogenase
LGKNIVLNADKAYGSFELRDAIEATGIKFNCQEKNIKTTVKTPTFDPKIYKLRKEIETIFAWFDNYKLIKYRTCVTLRQWDMYLNFAGFFINNRNLV